MLKSVFTFLAALALTACPNSKQSTPVASPSLEVKSDSDSAVGGNTSIQTSTETQTLWDLKDVKAVVDKTVALGAGGISVDETDRFPSLNIKYPTADYVKIMRCTGSFVLRTITGQRLEDVEGQFDAIEAKKDMWLIAFSQYDRCRLVGENYSLTNFLDISAKTGTYYYIINPCVRKEHAKTNKEACSYNFSITDPIQYESSFLENMTERAIELQKATNAMWAAIHEVADQAEKLALRLTACENHVAKRNSIQDFRRGLIALSLFLAGALTFERFGPLAKIPILKKVTGPNASMMGGIMVMSMAQGPVLKVLGIKNLSNTCLDAGSSMTPDIAKKSRLNYDDYMADAEALEAQFRVREALIKIQTLTKQDQTREQTDDPTILKAGDGQIYRLLQTLTLIQREIAKLETNFLKADAIIVEAEKAGVNIKDWKMLVDSVVPPDAAPATP